MKFLPVILGSKMLLIEENYQTLNMPTIYHSKHKSSQAHRKTGKAIIKPSSKILPTKV